MSEEYEIILGLYKSNNKMLLVIVTITCTFFSANQYLIIIFNSITDIILIKISVHKRHKSINAIKIYKKPIIFYIISNNLYIANFLYFIYRFYILD